MKRLFFFILACACAVFVHAKFPGEILLVPETRRAPLLAALEARGETHASTLAQAVWNNDETAIESAARAYLADEPDPFVQDLLARLLIRQGRPAEGSSCAHAVRTPLRANAAPTQPDLSGRRPLVFLHGYSGDATTWSDYQKACREEGYGADDLLIFQYYQANDLSEGCASELTVFNGTTDTPIESIAAQVVRATRIWLRRRAGCADDDASMDDTLPAPNWICHSMGGLVLRCVLAADSTLVHRAVTLGTPHFGQNIALSLAGYQTEQMKYGSSFLWHLNEDWFFRGQNLDRLLFVVGIGTNDELFDGDIPMDGLVCGFSATLLTLKNESTYKSQTFFANRVHSSVMTLPFVNDLPGLPELPKGRDDALYKLVHGYLTDTDYFANEQIPSWQEVLTADGMSDSRQKEQLEHMTSFGGLFLQAYHTTTNTPQTLARPVAYDIGNLYPDDILGYLYNNTTKTKYKNEYKYPWQNGKYSWEHGFKNEACTNGVVFVFGNIPAGDYTLSIEKPYRSPPPYTYPYTNHITLFGGGCEVMRSRPPDARPVSSFTLTDDAGNRVQEVIDNAWFVAQGLIAHEEDLSRACEVGETRQANGLTAAESHRLNLNPNDPHSVLAWSTFKVDSNVYSFTARLGDTKFNPANFSDTLIVQGAQNLNGEFIDLPFVWHEADNTSFGTFEPQGERFFRLKIRWP